MQLRVLFISFCALMIVGAEVAYAQTGVINIEVEVLPAPITLSISSSRIAFGQVNRDTGEVILHPDTGTRTGHASGDYSLGDFLIKGPKGARVTVQAETDFSLAAADGTLGDSGYRLLWAGSDECMPDVYSRIPATQIVSVEIGESGCQRFRLGAEINTAFTGTGVYQGGMVVQITGGL